MHTPSKVSAGVLLPVTASTPSFLSFHSTCRLVERQLAKQRAPLELMKPLQTNNTPIRGLRGRLSVLLSLFMMMMISLVVITIDNWQLTRDHLNETCGRSMYCCLLPTLTTFLHPFPFISKVRQTSRPTFTLFAVSASLFSFFCFQFSHALVLTWFYECIWFCTLGKQVC